MIKGIDFINDSKEMFDKKEIIIKANNNKEYTIEITPKIKDTELNKIINILMKNAEYCNKKNKEYNFVIDMFAQIIKAFSNIQFNKYKDTWKQIQHDIQVCSALIDLGVYNQIIEQFDKGSIIKLEESFAKYQKSFKMINNQVLSQKLKDDKDGKISI